RRRGALLARRPLRRRLPRPHPRRVARRRLDRPLHRGRDREPPERVDAPLRRPAPDDPVGPPAGLRLRRRPRPPASVCLDPLAPMSRHIAPLTLALSPSGGEGIGGTPSPSARERVGVRVASRPGTYSGPVNS